MGDVVNLRTVRKSKARDARAVEAQANRAKFGRTKGEKLRDAQEAERAARLLDGAKRDEP
ncbi:DUF4169 family protein [Novosphingobium taihuense]|uniref:DUF4169 domain-containing protein n=1 Tax=Novosphingobium taihuense TaxID=260085 RepID=A0A7W7ADU7_9SPHN|nr:DUF4169 family protein [Novosphingobium taihuense]MBB4615081.1 hypothetical protein [Novosphingobium taihuense]TWH84117.1 uncharacterized protein DUF4169 [Novosphingobium taihuense]